MRVDRDCPQALSIDNTVLTSGLYYLCSKKAAACSCDGGKYGLSYPFCRLQCYFSPHNDSYVHFGKEQSSNSKEHLQFTLYRTVERPTGNASFRTRCHHKRFRENCVLIVESSRVHNSIKYTMDFSGTNTIIIAYPCTIFMITVFMRR